MPNQSPHRKSAIEARYDKVWSTVRLGYSDLKRFIEAIKIGDITQLKSFLDSASPFNNEQKRALLTRCFNENDFNDTKGTSVKTAISLAEKYDNKPIINYLNQQKEQLPLQPFAKTGSMFHERASTSESEKKENPKTRPGSTT